MANDWESQAMVIKFGHRAGEAETLTSPIFLLRVCLIRKEKDKERACVSSHGAYSRQGDSHLMGVMVNTVTLMEF